ncbi:bifunctional demethylmenaquinone methyltransferase/2-methoxy-6-polyprenyl-1,4-benzoquinol methylase UbiE [Zavarzinella formosa]|uniref:bifunctional demethylmenaquinone methyltransferase/2-methoxy-6-polyprenyl-1,4-benzoquinol methylase UbiE n=1 Tax=Zavarzinella formosa TaxID=360055 RepID=UPI00049638F3|nr:bifunctional demethylmenaquinone methyltransferase/2-methoxy-6-polyprenyl-1,4-benzoquinol methylase UbiE [Zavarzinella formosa]
MNDLLDRREARIRRMFDGIAPKYDLLNHLLSLNIDKVWRKRVVKTVPATNGPVLDMCTGTGDLALEYFRATGGKVPIIGADFAGQMLELAVKKTVKKQADRVVHYVQADAQHLPFPDDLFEVVTVAFGLRNVTDPLRGLAEMTRVCRPGGKVAVLEFSRPRHWFLGRMYRGYFRYLLPRVGQMFSKSDENAYTYLPESVMKFPDGEELADHMRKTGLIEVTYTPFTFGVATLYVGQKKS